MESLHGRLRNELRKAELFDMLWEANMLIEHGRRDYNTRWPHSNRGCRLPSPDAFACPAGSTFLRALRPRVGLEALVL